MLNLPHPPKNGIRTTQKKPTHSRGRKVQDSVSETHYIPLTEGKTMRLIEQYKSCPASSGKTHYLRYLKGERLTHRQAILAKCAECNGGYKDGRHDCKIPACALYLYMPYKNQDTAFNQTEVVT
jgi:hypothetical protein